jgi:hypothetical protein
MDRLSEQYPTDQRKEKNMKHISVKKRKGSANSSNHIENEREAILFFNPHMVLIGIIVLNCLKYPQILKMLL